MQPQAVRINSRPVKQTLDKMVSRCGGTSIAIRLVGWTTELGCGETTCGSTNRDRQGAWPHAFRHVIMTTWNAVHAHLALRCGYGPRRDHDGVGILSSGANHAKISSAPSPALARRMCTTHFVKTMWNAKTHQPRLRETASRAASAPRSCDPGAYAPRFLRRQKSRFLKKPDFSATFLPVHFTRLKCSGVFSSNLTGRRLYDGWRSAE